MAARKGKASEMANESSTTAAKAASSKAKGAKIPFALLAPYNEDVQLMGEWDGWKPHKMKKDKGGVWRIDIPLEDGDYEYKFSLKSKSFFADGQQVEVADPTAIELGKTTRDNALVRVRDGHISPVNYAWKHDDVPLVPNDQLVIYEMHLGDFCGGPGDVDDQPGTFKTAIAKLDYLVDLGINAIELMPVTEIPGYNYWGYSQRSLYAVENRYGTPDELAEFVDECHARGIRVILDVVFNHMDTDSPLTMIDHNYFFYGENPDGPELQFGPKYNFEFHDEALGLWPARQHVIGAMHAWLDLFHLDGFRFDATRAIKYFDLLDWLNHEAHQREGFKPFLTIAEHIPQDPTIADADGPMDAAWHDNFFRQMCATTLGAEWEGRNPFDTDTVLNLMDGRNEGFASPYNTVHYLATHDQDHTMFLMGAHANLFDEAAFRRNKLGATLVLTSPGIPMIWMGEEFGQPTPRTHERQPLIWALLGEERNQGLHAHHKNLIALRKHNPALTSENYQPLVSESERGFLAFKRWSEGGNIVVVAANLRGDSSGEIVIPLDNIEDGIWRECIYGYEVQATNGILRDTLYEAEAKVYVKQ